MGEGEHTIITKIPRERLNQIASRKLSGLGIPVRLGQDRETLEGELVFGGKVLHPATGQTIARARFTVVGHDQLRFTDPPLSVLAPVPFYDGDKLPALEQRVASALQQRAVALHDLAARLRALKLEATVDPERLAVRAVVKAQTHAFELLGGPEGLRVSRLAPVGGKPCDVPASYPPIDLAAFPTLVDLEVHLCAAVPAMTATEADRRGSRAPEPPPRAAVLTATPPPRNAVTIGQLAEVFGRELALAPNAAVELIQEYQYGGTRYRFVATREVGTTFKGRLIGPEGDVWSDHFELASFPGTEKVVALALGAAAPGAAAAAPSSGGSGYAPTPAPGAAGPVPPHLLPHPGEIWVMSVVVEEIRDDEVRYVGTDIDGRPYGAARLLKRSDFEAVFSQDKGGWRLLVVIDQVQGDSVLYRQLDRQRQPIGAPRKMATSILVANFVPEAAAY